MTADEFIREWTDSSATVGAHTSGSTGAPKEIRLLKADMRASAMRTNAFFRLGQGSVYLCPLSPDYIAAKMMIVRALENNGQIIMARPSNEIVIPDGITVDLLAIVPSQTDSLLRSPESAARIRNIIIGGAELSEERRRGLVGCGYNAYETYGMTETCSHVALRKIGSEYFRALPGIEFSCDRRGCLTIHIDNFSTEYFTTNDMVELCDSKAFRWLGRYDNVINTGGIKIYAEQLEKEIAAIIGNTFPFYITSQPSEKWGYEIVMVAETSEESVAAVCRSIALAMPHTHVPKRYIAVSALPRTASGKIRRILPS